jgi:hypothetical protein
VTEALWAVDYPDGQDRELTLAEIEKELIAGAIDFATLVWREGMDEWQEIGQVPELQGIEGPTRIVRAPTAQVLAAQTPPAAPARAKAPSAPAIEPSKPDLPKPRPPAPSTPGFDSPRDEISKPTGSAPRPPAPTMSGIGQPPPPVALPFEMPPAPPAFSAAPAFPAPSFPAPPAPPVMVPAPAIAAPFATPVQPFPGAKAPSARAPSSATGVPEWPEERKNRAPLILGVILLLVAIAGGLYAWKSSQDEKPPPPTPISALPPTTPPATHTAEPAADSPTQAPPATPPQANTAAGASRSALDPPSGSLSATPNAGFAEMFANGARNADDKKGGQHFDLNAANKALATAAFETAKCKEAGGPTGLATVMVTFDPSGKVSSATVSDAPFAGTSSGACIAATMKRATVPPFTGLPGTATKIISIQ